MGIADVIRILGFTTAETEPLATTVYAEAGEACLRYTGGYIEAVMQNARKAHPNIADAEVKRIVTQAIIASNFVAMITALAESGIPTNSLVRVIVDVLKFIDNQNAKALEEQASKKPKGDLN